MKARDLLKDLIEGRITSEQAEDICSEVLDDTSASAPVHETLGMSKREWTAYAHGAEFSDVANWRVHGWPDRCFVCGQSIVLDNYGWLARQHEGKMQLKHVVCPKVD